MTLAWPRASCVRWGSACKKIFTCMQPCVCITMVGPVHGPCCVMTGVGRHEDNVQTLEVLAQTVADGVAWIFLTGIILWSFTCPTWLLKVFHKPCWMSFLMLFDENFDAGMEVYSRWEWIPTPTKTPQGSLYLQNLLEPAFADFWVLI